MEIMDRAASRIAPPEPSSWQTGLDQVVVLRNITWEQYDGIYRRLGVAEVWFWVNGKIWVYLLIDGAYEERAHSQALPNIDHGMLERIIAASDDETDQIDVIRAFRASLRSR